MNTTNIIFTKCCRFDTDSSFCTPISRNIYTTKPTLASIFIISLFSANHNSIIINHVAHCNIGIGRNRIITVLNTADIGYILVFGLSLDLHTIWNNRLPTSVAHIK